MTKGAAVVLAVKFVKPVGVNACVPAVLGVSVMATAVQVVFAGIATPDKVKLVPSPQLVAEQGAARLNVVVLLVPAGSGMENAPPLTAAVVDALNKVTVSTVGLPAVTGFTLIALDTAPMTTAGGGTVEGGVVSDPPLQAIKAPALTVAKTMC